jgi:predicted ATPase
MSVALHTSFVGRKTELTLLDTAFASAVAGSPQVLFIGGEAGVGKTRLVAEFATRVEDDARVLTGHCYELSAGGLPYGPAIEMLRRLARSLDPSARRELLEPAEAELGRVVPTGESNQGWPSDNTARSVQAQFFELVLRFVGRIARRWPLVLVAEDLHWADRSTLDLLMFLVYNLDRERVLVVGTYRSEELHGHFLRTVLLQSERSPRARRIELAGFGQEELMAQLHGLLGNAPPARLAAEILARSEGNAFFAEELLTAAAGTSGTQLPHRLRDVILRRFEGLSEDAQDVLRVVATAGRRVGYRIVAAASDQERQALRRALREAVAQQFLVVEDGRTYRFRHELAREAVYNALLPDERGLFHAALARALTEDASHDGGEAITIAAELAHHWHAADEPAMALAASVAAGRQAARMHAFAEAHRQLERALVLWPRVPSADARAGITREQLLEQAADNALWAGDVDRALALARKALAGIDPARTPDLAGVFQERLGHYLWRWGDNKGSLAALEEATRLFASEGASAERARVQAEHAKLLMISGRYGEARALAEKAVAMARAIGARRVEGHAMNTLGPCLTMLGDPDAGLASLLEARSIAAEVENIEDIIRAYSNLAWTLELVGRLEEAVNEMLAGLAVARALDLDLTMGATLLINAINQLFLIGRWTEEDDLLRRAVRLEGSVRYGSYVSLFQGELALARGRVEEAAAHLETARQAASRLEPQFIGPLYALVAEVASYRGDLELAGKTVREGLDLLVGSDDEPPALRLCAMGVRAAADAAEVARRDRDLSGLDEARATGGHLLGQARERTGRLLDPGTTLPEATAMLAVCEAEWTRLEGRAEPQAWAAAAGSWERLLEPYRACYARWRQAQAMLAQEVSAEGVAVLRQAHRVAVRLGAERLRQDLVTLAGRHDIPLPPSDSPGR